MAPLPYLAVAAETVNSTLSGIERAGTWSDHVLSLGMFVLIIGAAVVLLRMSFRQTAQERAGRETERKEYIESLKSIAQNNAVALERTTSSLDRNTSAFSKLEGLREAFERLSASVAGLIALATKLDLDWRLERRTDGERVPPNSRRSRDE